MVKKFCKPSCLYITDSLSHSVETNERLNTKRTPNSKYRTSFGEGNRNYVAHERKNDQLLNILWMYIGVSVPMSDGFHHPQTKLREGNVLTPVCGSVHKGWGVHGRGSWCMVGGGMCVRDAWEVCGR